jgi:hypothetical protein
MELNASKKGTYLFLNGCRNCSSHPVNSYFLTTVAFKMSLRETISKIINRLTQPIAALLPEEEDPSRGQSSLVSAPVRPTTPVRYILWDRPCPELDDPEDWCCCQCKAEYNLPPAPVDEATKATVLTCQCGHGACPGCQAHVGRYWLGVVLHFIEMNRRRNNGPWPVYRIANLEPVEETSNLAQARLERTEPRHRVSLELHFDHPQQTPTPNLDQAQPSQAVRRRVPDPELHM